MPNWCYTCYAITGNREQVEDLYQKMKTLEDSPEPPLENGLGNLWLGNLIHSLGGDEKTIYCKGKIELPIEFENGAIRVTVMSAWSELNEVRRFIEAKYPDIKIYYQFDGCDFCYFTNDKDKLFFKEQYIIDIPTDDTYYYSELSEVLAVASELTGQTLTTKEEITDAFEDYEMQMQEVNPDYLISFYEYEFEE